MSGWRKGLPISHTMVQELFQSNWNAKVRTSRFYSTMRQHHLQKFAGLKRAREVNLQGVIAMETWREIVGVRQSRQHK